MTSRVRTSTSAVASGARMEPTRPGTRRAGRMRVTPEAVECLRPRRGATEDQRLLENRPEPAFLDTDPWRALRSCPSSSTASTPSRPSGRRSRSSAPRERSRDPITSRAGPSVGSSPRPASPSSPAAVPASWRPRTAAARRAAAVCRLQHRAAPRAAAQPVRRPRRRVPLLLRAQDHVREVRGRVRDPPGGFGTLDELFESSR